MTQQAIRYGEVNYINALPLHLDISKVPNLSIEKAFLHPTGLNQAMLKGELDISSVSSAFYLRHKDQFTLIPGLSISAEKKVESVLFFSKTPFDNLHDAPVIALPDASETSIALLLYLIDRMTGQFYEGKFQYYRPGQGQVMLDAGIPTLSIGNEALSIKQTISPQWHTLDLADAWANQMHLPFVFAVWIAQKDWAEQNPQTLIQIQTALWNQKKAFYTDKATQEQIIQKAYQHCPHLPVSVISHYLNQALSYDLEEPHQLALTWFETIINWLDHDRTQTPDRYRPVVSI